MNAVTMRAATDKDSESIKALVFIVLEEFGLASDSSGIDKDLDAIEVHYHSNRGYFGVTELDNKIVATVGLANVDNETCELRKMYILPNQRGKGLGRYLLEFSLDKARALGYQRMILETAAPLKSAIAMYKKYGFQPFTPAHLSSRCDQAFELNL